MSKLFLAFASVLSLFAGSEAVLAASPDEVCKSLGDLAQQTMINKQRGVAMTDMMAGMAKVYEGGALEMMREMIVDAYSLPNFSTEAMKQKQVVEFRNANELVCYQTMAAAVND